MPVSYPNGRRPLAGLAYCLINDMIYPLILMLGHNITGRAYEHTLNLADSRPVRRLATRTCMQSVHLDHTCIQYTHIHDMHMQVIHIYMHAYTCMQTDHKYIYIQVIHAYSTHACIRIHACRHVINTGHMHTVYMYMHTCVHTYIRTCMHAYLHTYMHTHTYIHTYIHTCIHTYIQTYIHAYISK